MSDPFLHELALSDRIDDSATACVGTQANAIRHGIARVWELRKER
jgi:hypothetical protein